MDILSSSAVLTSGLLAIALSLPRVEPVWDTIKPACREQARPDVLRDYAHYHDALRAPPPVEAPARVSTSCPPRKTLRT
jgi:hypothetical protein